MKKRKKSKDESCITSLFKTALFIGIFLWGMICMSRTVNYKSWAVLIIIGVSFLLVKLFKNDDYVGEHTMYCSFGCSRLCLQFLFSYFHTTTRGCHTTDLHR